MQLSEQIDVIKTCSLATDLHMEAFLPLQMATIAFEVGKGITKDPKKFIRFFGEIVHILEKKLVSICCDHPVTSSRYQKLTYKIPDDLKEYNEGVLNSVTLVRENSLVESLLKND